MQEKLLEYLVELKSNYEFKGLDFESGLVKNYVRDKSSKLKFHTQSVAEVIQPRGSKQLFSTRLNRDV